MNSTTPQALTLSQWDFAFWWPWYVLLCVGIALIVRLLMATLRAWAVQRGDYPGGPQYHKAQVPFGRALKTCFFGFSYDKRHVDLWLPAAIAFAEIFAYPILMVLGRFEIIGGWLLLKTAGQWSGWKESRTSFNRFLFNNIINIGISYFVLSRFCIVAHSKPSGDSSFLGF